MRPSDFIRLNPSRIISIRDRRITVLILPRNFESKINPKKFKQPVIGDLISYYDPMLNMDVTGKVCEDGFADLGTAWSIAIPFPR